MIGVRQQYPPLNRHARDCRYRSRLGVEQPMSRICVRLAPCLPVFRHSALCGPLEGDTIRLSILTVYWRRSYYQGDIIAAISVGQPSRILWPCRPPYSDPLSSEPTEMKGPLRKRYLGLQPGTTFAQTDPDTGPRPRRSRSGPLPLSQAQASPYRGNRMGENAA